MGGSCSSSCPGYSSSGHPVEVWFPEADCKNVWPSLLREIGSLLLLSSLEASMQGRHCQSQEDEGDMLTSMASRVSRATGLANLGELSRARQALAGDVVAPGKDSAWKLLTGEVRRPRFPPEPLRREFVDMNAIRGRRPGFGSLDQELEECTQRSCGWAIRHDHRASQALAGERGVHRILWGKRQPGWQEAGCHQRSCPGSDWDA